MNNRETTMADRQKRTFVIEIPLENSHTASPAMQLSSSQENLLKQLDVDPEVGLSTDQASARREQAGSFNVVPPPIQCPAWACILLPCIKNIPSMKAYREIKPDDAEVLRNGKYIRYDAASLVKGDIIRLEEGDIVPADCVVLTVENELVVDHRNVTGEIKPRSSRKNSQGLAQATQLFWGGHIVEGSGIVVATAVGPDTLVASLIRESKFPPQGPVIYDGNTVDTTNSEEEAGISLVSQTVV